MSKHDAECLRRKAQTGWGYICTCALTDEQVATTVTQCDQCDALPPIFPFPSCKCYE